MCELIKAGSGVIPGKIWAYGPMPVRTPNHPQCTICWNFHVAPFVYVSLCNGERQMRVIDPSLFDQAVPWDIWTARFGTSWQTITVTDMNVYLQTKPGVGTTEEQHDRRDLLCAQLELWLRTIDPNVGPPPYAHCTVTGGTI
jgi:hypothetical protein